jgi:hypothetical protein
MSPFKYTATTLFLIALSCVSFVLPSGIFRTTIFLGTFLALSYLIGLIWTQTPSRLSQTIWGTIILTSLYTCLGTAAYYLFNFSTTTALSLWLLTPALLILPKLSLQKTNPSTTNYQLPITSYSQIGYQLLIIAIGFFLTHKIHTILTTSATGNSLRTPWSEVPTSFFVYLGTLIILTIILAWQKRRTSLILAAFTTFSALSVAVIIYKIGFGFDPFLHRAAEQFIFDHGLITPKTFYYIGQYINVTAIAHALALPISLVDRWFLPILASTLPLVSYTLFESQYNRRAALLASIATLIIPLNSFISTTPQGLANLLLILTLFSIFVPNLPRTLPLLLAATTATIHPLIGIPLGLALSAKYIWDWQKTSHTKWIAWLIICLSIVSVPLMFFLNSILSGTSLELSKLTLQPNLLTNLFGLTPHRLYQFIPDLAYGWLVIRPLTLLTLTILTAYHYHKKNQLPVTSYQLLLIPISLFSNALILSTFQLPFLVPSEQLNYAARLSEAALLATTPFILTTIISFFQKSVTQSLSHSVTIFTSLSLTSLILSSTYLAYPRLDAYASNRGFSTGQDDISTVQAIENDAEGQPYLVLANQSVSAAAIQEFGFAHYYPNSDTQNFYYPIPTSSPLHDIFLNLNYAYGDRKIAEQAFAQTTTNITKVYFVVNNYWWDSARTIDNAKTQANEWFAPSPTTTVFVYFKK